MSYNRYPYELPPLPYSYGALEPYIDAETMYIHHDKLFAGYVERLNNVLKYYTMLQNWSLEDILSRPNALPRSSRVNILRNAGGVYNHTLFFEQLAPASEDNHLPTGRLIWDINQNFGSFEKFKELFSQSAANVFGSGYTFLVRTSNGKLKIENTENQTNPIEWGCSTIILLDVWEHAYFLEYKNLRTEYINNFWNIVSFKEY